MSSANAMNILSQVCRNPSNSDLFLTSENGMEIGITKLAYPIFVLSVMEVPPTCVFPKSVVDTKFVRIDDDPDEDLLAILKPCTKWIHSAMQTPNANVIVHCAAGISRSASVVIAYLMEYYNFTFAAALKFVKDKRKIVDPNDGFLESLEQYETQLNGER